MTSFGQSKSRNVKCVPEIRMSRLCNSSRFDEEAVIVRSDDRSGLPRRDIGVCESNDPLVEVADPAILFIEKASYRAAQALPKVVRMMIFVLLGDRRSYCQVACGGRDYGGAGRVGPRDESRSSALRPDHVNPVRSIEAPAPT